MAWQAMRAVGAWLAGCATVLGAFCMCANSLFLCLYATLPAYDMLVGWRWLDEAWHKIRWLGRLTSTNMGCSIFFFLLIYDT